MFLGSQKLILTFPGQSGSLLNWSLLSFWSYHPQASLIQWLLTPVLLGFGFLSFASFIPKSLKESRRYDGKLTEQVPGWGPGRRTLAIPASSSRVLIKKSQVFGLNTSPSPAGRATWLSVGVNYDQTRWGLLLSRKFLISVQFAGSLSQVSIRKVLLILHIQRDLHDIFRQRAINMGRNTKTDRIMDQGSHGQGCYQEVWMGGWLGGCLWKVRVPSKTLYRFCWSTSHESVLTKLLFSLSKQRTFLPKQSVCVLLHAGKNNQMGLSEVSVK